LTTIRPLPAAKAAPVVLPVIHQFVPDARRFLALPLPLSQKPTMKRSSSCAARSQARTAEAIPEPVAG
jgi:hypothetical protein